MWWHSTAIFPMAVWLCITVNQCHVHAQSWLEPSFIDAGTPGITLEDLVGRMGIAMEEEIQWPFKLVEINYDGPETPTVSRTNSITQENLKLSFIRTSPTWTVFVQNRQDYENPDQQRYDIDVSIGSTSKRLIIATINIFDNEPRLSYDGPCMVEELQSNVTTECRFTVYHPDGILNNAFELTIQGQFNEAEKFGFTMPLLETKYTREYSLIVLKELRFEERAMYNFRTTVFDVVGKSSQIMTLVQVIDVPSMPPQWTKPFATARFIEKSAQEFQVNAVDGDTDINKDIWYELGFYENQDYSQLIAIDKNSGKIDVQPINRDELKQEIFPFNIIAYKADNRSWAIEGEAVIVVDDLNDNIPTVTLSHTHLQIMEETYLTLPIERLVVDDIDLGVHATYTVSLDGGRTSIDYAKPFLVIPDNGYQESFFTITVTDAKLLDFEIGDWQQFTVTVVATEHDNATHIGRQEFTIELLNWNDEIPIFAQSLYSVEVNETIAADQSLIKVTANDRDIGDTVEHSIVGLSELSISKEGEIRTEIENTFDYDRQRLVIVQIQATDTLQINGITDLHTAYTQLQIHVLDVNNKTPEMRMPRNSPNMDENEQDPYTVTKEGIIVTDPDTTADIRFTIDWDLTYATKAGQDADKRLYKDCFLIEADRTNPNRVIGYVVVNPAFPLLIDYEEYEVIYLYVTATDHEQVVNDNSTDAVLTIRINDLNDNYPLFILDTLNTARSVIEEATAGTLIGSIFANDIDGPQFNKITYTMVPASGTPDGWIDIDAVNGELRVAAGAVIGCDQPQIFNLVYEVTISDSELTTSGQIQIYIHDINNRIPIFGSFETIVRRYENITTGEIIQSIVASDLDRDSPNNLIQYSIDYTADQDRYFKINTEKGVLLAELQGNTIFDRDRGYKSFDIQVKIQDNYQGNGRVNQATNMLSLILLDVNDNAPELPEVDKFTPVISENNNLNTAVGTIQATDIDDETTPNARIGYAIRSVLPLAENPQPLPNAVDELLRINETTGAIRLAMDARGFYGQWSVLIEAFDHGHEWTTQLQLRSSQTYTFTVQPYNFHAPEIVQPSIVDGLLFRLDFYAQQVSTPLKLIDGVTPFPLLLAVDPDGGTYGDVHFQLASTSSGSNDADHFTLFQVDAKSAQLYLQRPVEARFYHLNVRAIDGGDRMSEWTTNVTLVFVDMSGEPVFEESVWHTDFTENITGLEERRTLPMALDPKNVGVSDPTQLTTVYYFIDPDYRPDDAKRFRLNYVSRELSLVEQLDREDIDRHVFRVVATNRQLYPANPQPSAFVTVNVTVNDVNDNPPRFEYSSYGSGITTMDAIGKHLLTVLAFDPDLDDVITYVIQSNSYMTSDPSLKDIVLANPFELHPDNGELKLNFAVSADMKGHIEFKIQAFDLVLHEDVCNVKIYIIAESNLVSFMFLNDKEFVDQQRERIGKILSEFYQHECYIDDITKSEVDNVAQDTMTTLRAHFIDNNEAIEAADIFSRSNDVLFIGQVKSALLQVGINLLDVPTPQGVSDDGQSEVEMLHIILIAVSVVLGAILAALIVFFTVRERSLTRQLRALSMPVYEPDAIDAVAKPPNTNAFAVESAANNLRSLGTADVNDLNMKSAYADLDNPNIVIFDNLSLISGSSSHSEFVGIEDDPTFISKDFSAYGANTAVINDFGQRLAADEA